VSTIETPRRPYQHRQAMSQEAFIAEVIRQQDTKHDMAVDTRRVGWNTEEDGHTYLTIDGAEEYLPSTDGPYQGWVVNSHAHTQVATKLDIPGRYYGRMRKEAPDLLDQNVRHWFREAPERRLFRTLDGRLRAFLSDRYKRRDNFDLIEALWPDLRQMMERDGLEFHVASLTDTNMYLRMVNPTVTRAIKVGDVVQSGVEIKNSEVGHGQLEVSPFVWRLVCLNGMVMPKAIATRHVGRRITEDDLNLQLYSQETLAADDAAYFLKVRDVVRATMTQARFDQIVQPMVEAAESTPVFSPPATVEHLATTFDLTKPEQESVLRNLTLGGDLTRWGMANAITAAAKTSATFDRLVDLERAGGSLLQMSETAWREAARA
jgi:hypothetical protein